MTPGQGAKDCKPDTSGRRSDPISFSSIAAPEISTTASPMLAPCDSDIKAYTQDMTALDATRRRLALSRSTEADSEIAHRSTTPLGLSQAQGRELLSYNDIPSWYQDNEYIRFGYRPVSYSVRKCLASLLYVHNETFNIYSHLIAAILFLVAQGMVAAILSYRYHNATAGDYVIFAIFLATATVTLALSSTYHTMCNHSQPVYSFWLRMDFAGILLLNVGDFVSGIYLVFFCDRRLQIAYWAMTLSLGAMTAVLVVHPWLQGPRWRAFRVGAFISTGLTGLIPLAHGLAIYGWEHMWAASGMPYYLLEGGLLVAGAMFYSTRFPEAVWPGKFDAWGASHNIFHVLVVVATIVHLIGIALAYDWNDHNSTCRA